MFTNLIQIDKKKHVPVTVHFPDYAFNENIHRKKIRKNIEKT